MIALSILLAFIIMNLATFVVYGVKAGLEAGFVVLCYLSRKAWGRQWFLYASVWWGTFAIIEIGQAAVPAWMDALGGIISEAVYFPASAQVARRLLQAG